MSKVCVVICGNYEDENVYNQLKRAINLLGGIYEIVGESKTVLLKPNLLAASAPNDAVTTHPAVFSAVARIFSENKYNMTYGDSPGIGNPEKVASLCGLDSAAQKYNLKFAEFTKGQTVHFKEGKVTKQFEISNAAIEADSIISISKMKTHQLTRITGAIKNQLGCVYGFNKGMSHSKFPNSVIFSKMLVDLNMLLKPKLYIMDGIVAMEGNGPRSGSPVKMNVLIVSKDPVAVDSIFCRIVDLNPEYIPAIIYGEKYGLGKWRDEDLEIIGDDISLLTNKKFDVVREPVEEIKMKYVANIGKRFLRKPVVLENKCIKCGICIEACPVEGKAIKYKKVKTPPVINYNKCIRCFCCQEMCPEKAIDVKTPLLGKLLIYKNQ